MTDISDVLLKHHRYYKILRKDLFHQGIQYQFDVSMCIPGGMYFCTLEDIPRWLDLYEDNETIAEVHFLPQSKVEQVGRRKFRADWILLRNPVPIPKFIRRYFEPMPLLEISPFLIRYMENPSNILQYYAVNENAYALEHIKEPNADVCLLAVENNPNVLRYVRYHSMDIYRVAIPKNGMALAYVEEKYWTLRLYRKDILELSLAAVKQNGLALQFVKHQTPEICEAAVAQNGYALPMVWPALKTPEVCRLAWKENRRALDFATSGFKERVGQRKIVIH